jgi:putative methyltransferase
VHDLLLAKRGIALPATHGLRTAVERHKGRLQAELTKARIRRKLSSVESLKAHIESGQEIAADNLEAPYPRWVRINTLKTTLEDQLETTFAECGRAMTVDSVRQRNSKQLYLDEHVPNLVAVSPCVDLQKSEAYKSGSIIFQDKASCFPAYLLDPLTEDGDIIDTCSAPGNKTTHIAAILLSHNSEPEDCIQTIHAFEKNKGRAVTLEKMVNLAGLDAWIKIHPGQDFLKTDPNSPMFKDVGALLLDPSCSGSGIVGRDDMPELHMPGVGQNTISTSRGSKKASQNRDTRKRKREEDEDLIMVDDDGVLTSVDTDDELKSRLAALSAFQVDILRHAFKFPAARKITYSTCSIHADENESVVKRALASDVAKQSGWRILTRDEQIRGMREWPIRGSHEACGEDTLLMESCIRATKGDEHGTMGFFLAGFVRDQRPVAGVESQFLRDERGHIVRDLLGMPVRAQPADRDGDGNGAEQENSVVADRQGMGDEEWNGFSEDEGPALDQA